jgi:hypothetical protein
MGNDQADPIDDASQNNRQRANQGGGAYEL